MPASDVALLLGWDWLGIASRRFFQGRSPVAWPERLATTAIKIGKHPEDASLGLSLNPGPSFLRPPVRGGAPPEW
jgi:hypothetical protein